MKTIENLSRSHFYVLKNIEHFKTPYFWRISKPFFITVFKNSNQTENPIFFFLLKTLLSVLRARIEISANIFMCR